MKKKIYSLLLIGVLSFNMSSTPVFASGVDTINQQEIASELNGTIITTDELPDNVIPIKFDNIEQAKKYIQLSEQMLSEGKSLNLSENQLESAYDSENNIMDFSNLNITEKDYQAVSPKLSQINDSSSILSTNTGVKTYSKSMNLTASFNIYAKYSYANSKFKSVISVTSTYTGLTIGNSWTQDTYSSSITSSGKKLNVTVYGHFDHYIIIDTTLTQISSTKKQYSASWDY